MHSEFENSISAVLGSALLQCANDGARPMEDLPSEEIRLHSEWEKKTGLKGDQTAESQLSEANIRWRNPSGGKA